MSEDIELLSKQIAVARETYARVLELDEKRREASLLAQKSHERAANPSNALVEMVSVVSLPSLDPPTWRWKLLLAVVCVLIGIGAVFAVHASANSPIVIPWNHGSQPGTYGNGLGVYR